MPRKTIYIKDEDALVWERAESLLEKGQSLSSVISASLTDFVESKEISQKGMQRLEVTIGGGLSRYPTKKQSFIGRWLIERYYENDYEMYYYVAITQKNNIAVFVVDVEKGGQPVNVYSTLAEAEEGLPTSVFEQVVEELGLTEVEELDI